MFTPPSLSLQSIKRVPVVCHFRLGWGHQTVMSGICTGDTKRRRHLYCHPISYLLQLVLVNKL